MSYTPRYCAYVDGSARPQRREFGIGGVMIDTTNQGRRIAFSRSVDDITSCVEAEIRASVFALNQIPEDSVVRLHSDCLVLVNRLNEGAAIWALRSYRTSAALNNAYAEAKDAVARHKLVTAFHSTEAQTRYILAAHRLAKAGAKGYGTILPGFFNNIAAVYDKGTSAAHRKLYGEGAIDLDAIREAATPLVETSSVIDLHNRKGVRRLRDVIAHLPVYGFVFDERPFMAA